MDNDAFFMMEHSQQVGHTQRGISTQKFDSMMSSASHQNLSALPTVFDPISTDYLSSSAYLVDLHNSNPQQQLLQTQTIQQQTPSMPIASQSQSITITASTPTTSSSRHNTNNFSLNSKDNYSSNYFIEQNRQLSSSSSSSQMNCVGDHFDSTFNNTTINSTLKNTSNINCNLENINANNLIDSQNQNASIMNPSNTVASASFMGSDFLTTVKQEEHDSTECHPHLLHLNEYDDYLQPLEDHPHPHMNSMLLNDHDDYMKLHSQQQNMRQLQQQSQPQSQQHQQLSFFGFVNKKSDFDSSCGLLPAAGNSNNINLSNSSSCGNLNINILPVNHQVALQIPANSVPTSILHSQIDPNQQLTTKMKRIMKREKAKSRRKLTLELQEGQQRNTLLSDDLEPIAKQESDISLQFNSCPTALPSMPLESGPNSHPINALNNAWATSLSSSSYSASNQHNHFTASIGINSTNSASILANGQTKQNISAGNPTLPYGNRRRSGTGSSWFEVKSESTEGEHSCAGGVPHSNRSNQMNDQLLLLESKYLSGQMTAEEELQSLKMMSKNGNNFMDAKQQKKVMQMIRNRISAQNSRDRKKAYISKLEKDNEKQTQDIKDDLLFTTSELQRQTEENQRLEEEIEQLKATLAEQERTRSQSVPADLLSVLSEGQSSTTNSVLGIVKVFTEKPTSTEEDEIIQEVLSEPFQVRPSSLSQGGKNDEGDQEKEIHSNCMMLESVQPSQWITVTLPKKVEGKITKITAQVDSVQFVASH